MQLVSAISKAFCSIIVTLDKHPVGALALVAILLSGSIFLANK